MASAAQSFGADKPRKGYPGIADKARANEFRRRYLAGETLEQIASDWNVSRERVRQILRKAEVPSQGYRPRKPEPITPTQAEVAKLYEQGVHPGELVARFGLSHHQILHACRKAGVEIRGRGDWTRRPDDAEITAKVAELYSAGIGATEIVRRVPQVKFPETVYYYLRKAGVGARNGHSRPITWDTTKAGGERRRAQIRELHSQGLTSPAIAEAASLHMNTVYQALRSMGLKSNRRPRKERPPRQPRIARSRPERDWAPEEIAVLRYCWNAGASARQIGEALNRSRNAILGKIHRLGLNRGRA